MPAFAGSAGASVFFPRGLFSALIDLANYGASIDFLPLTKLDEGSKPTLTINFLAPNRRAIWPLHGEGTSTTALSVSTETSG